MIPCTETSNGEIHVRDRDRTLCGKDGVGAFDIGRGQWGERDGEMPPLRWCKVCTGLLKIDFLSRLVLSDVLNRPPENFRNAMDLALMRNPPGCSHARYAAMVRSVVNALAVKHTKGK